jgi:hypothetical protein
MLKERGERRACACLADRELGYALESVAEYHGEGIALSLEEGRSFA